MANLKSLNKLPSTRVFIFAAEKWMVRSTGVGGLFLLKMGTFSAKNWQEISIDAIFYFAEMFWKRKGQIHSNFEKWRFFNLTPHSS